MRQRERSIIAVWSRLPIKHSCERKNNRHARVYIAEQCENGTFTHWNDRRTKQNINFLLAATVAHMQGSTQNYLSDVFPSARL